MKKNMEKLQTKIQNAVASKFKEIVLPDGLNPKYDGMSTWEIAGILLKVIQNTKLEDATDFFTAKYKEKHYACCKLMEQDRCKKGEKCKIGGCDGSRTGRDADLCECECHNDNHDCKLSPDKSCDHPSHPEV